MTINLLYFSVTIQKNKWSLDQIEARAHVKQIEEKMFDQKAMFMHRFM